MEKLSGASGEYMALDLESMRLSANETVELEQANMFYVTVLSYEDYEFLKKFEQELAMQLQKLLARTT